MKHIVLTKADKWLIGVLSAFCFVGIILSFVLFQRQDTVTAQIRVDGNLVKTIQLREGYHEEYRIGGSTEYAIIEAQDETHTNLLGVGI